MYSCLVTTLYSGTQLTWLADRQSQFNILRYEKGEYYSDEIFSSPRYISDQSLLRLIMRLSLTISITAIAFE